MTPEESKNDPEMPSTKPCVLNPKYHYIGFRMQDGYSMTVCISCGKIFSIEKGPELDVLRKEVEEKDEKIAEYHNAYEGRKQAVCLLESQLSEARKEIIRQIGLGQAIANQCDSLYKELKRSQAESLGYRRALEELDEACPIINCQCCRIDHHISSKALSTPSPYASYVKKLEAVLEKAKKLSNQLEKCSHVDQVFNDWDILNDSLKSAEEARGKL